MRAAARASTSAIAGPGKRAAGSQCAARLSGAAWAALLSLALVAVACWLVVSLFGREAREAREAREVRVERFALEGGGEFVLHEIDGLLTHEQCDRIVAAAELRGLEDAETIDNANAGAGAYTSYNPKHRTSRTAFLADGALPEVDAVARWAERLSGLPRSHQEPLQVAHYTERGEFKDHYDACDEAEEACLRLNRGSGSRVSTLLVYLNDGYEGGETTFPNVGVSIKPRKGNAVYFVGTDGSGAILGDSLHRGSQVRGGEKWICTKWTHLKAYPTEP